MKNGGNKMKEKIELGDVVQLKSGGPKMTVEKIDEDGKLTCVWFDKNEQYRETFDMIALEKSKAKVASFETISG